MGKGKYIKELKEFIKRVSEEFRIKEIILFGSRANGTEKKDSDIDLIIVSPDFEGMNFFQRGASMYNYWTLNVPVDFLCYTEKEFNFLKKRISVVKDSLENGIVI